jgi:hypothetical protein
LIDVAPRMRMDMPPPGSLLSITCTPATLLSMSCSALTMRPGLNSSAETFVTAPVTLPARCVP